MSQTSRVVQEDEELDDLMESKLEEVDQFLIRAIWPRSHVDWAYSSSIGASGGIITISLDERMGSSVDVNEANTFNDFISRSGLCDLQLGGRRFTRFDKEGRKASKLDGFLPFRIFDTWIGTKGFHDLVLDSWATSLATRPSSNPHIVLKDKLKKLRMDIKPWTFACTSDQNNSRDFLKNELLEWDLKAEDGARFRP
nr:cytochrome P450 [Tanacetum cinerariifolium]